MQFDMVCACGAALQLEVFNEENELGAWLLIHRFTNAHISCGFMTRPEFLAETRESKEVEIKEKNEP